MADPIVVVIPKGNGPSPVEQLYDRADRLLNDSGVFSKQADGKLAPLPASKVGNQILNHTYTLVRRDEKAIEVQIQRGKETAERYLLEKSGQLGQISELGVIPQTTYAIAGKIGAALIMLELRNKDPLEIPPAVTKPHEKRTR